MHDNINTLVNAIAIIGLDGVFPASKDLDEWWANLRDGKELVTFFTDEELAASGLPPQLLSDPHLVRSGAVLEDVTSFDASFFGFNPREAEATDPQHRLFLETCYHALENAGYVGEYTGKIAVFGGQSINTYLLSNLMRNPEVTESIGGYQLMIGNDKDFLTTQVSYKLNLRGPSVNVQTACSTSLVAVHIACQSLLSGECDIALAGGVSVKVPQRKAHRYQEGHIISPDGHCRPFDVEAKGTLDGNGAGVVVLKRLSEALRDRDNIRAVIRGSAINNDGSEKIGYTAPSENGQAEVIAEAMAVGGISPETVTYVEAHGTGTTLGDPIEIAGLTQAFRAGTKRKQFCAVGSVKSNMGHLDAAAGVAGLIKTVLAMENRQLPPSINFSAPNPRIDFASSPFYVNGTLQAWESGGGPRRAGISSFGIGGTNSHVVVEEAPARAASGASRTQQLLCVSAKTRKSLDAITDNLASYLRENTHIPLADVAFTLHTGRRHHEHRRTVVATDPLDAAHALASRDPQRVFTQSSSADSRPVVFMLPGQGSQTPNMGKDLYDNEPVFRQELDRVAELIQVHAGFDVRDAIFPKPESLAMAAEQLRQTSTTQPALFAVEYATAKLWMSLGVQPSALIGHSVGEYVAAALARVFTLEDAVRLIVVRGRLIQSMPAGSMLAVPLGEDEVRTTLDTSLSIAAVNAPAVTVVSGPTPAIEAYADALTKRAVQCQMLHTSHAFHSSMMDPMLPAFEAEVRRTPLRAPEIPFLSNVTGTWITAAQATDPTYWVKHVRGTVRFAQGAAELLKDPRRILLEVGPGQTLSALAKRQLQPGSQHLMLATMKGIRDEQTDTQALLHATGRLWMAGTKLDWTRFYAQETRNRVPAPLYVFDKQRYWVEPKADVGAAPRNDLARRASVSDWLYVPSWSRVPLPHSPAEDPAGSWLFFEDKVGIAGALAAKLEASGASVLRVREGAAFGVTGEGQYQMRPDNRDDYTALIASLVQKGCKPDRVLHAWTLTAPVAHASVEDCISRGFYSLLYFMQAAEGKLHLAGITALSNEAQGVTGREWIVPEKATVLGPCKVIPHEFEGTACQSIDVVLPSSPAEQQELLASLQRELMVEPQGQMIAYRDRYRWVHDYKPLPLQASPSSGIVPRKATFVITGGLGGLGLIFAQHLARTAQARLILVGRTALPEPSTWDAWLQNGAEDATSRRIRNVRMLEALGSEVLAISADVTDAVAMKAAIDRGRARFGDIHGVLHAAGLPGGGIIQLKDHAAAERIMAPKIAGLRNLIAALGDQKPACVVLFSSINAVIGVSGQVDYTAANIYLDAFAHAFSREHGIPCVSVNWDTWKEAGMAVNTAVPANLAHIREQQLAAGIASAEGLDVFDRVLASGLTQVVVSTRDLHARIRTHTPSMDRATEADIPSTEDTRAHDRPDLGTAYVPARSDVDKVLIHIWGKLLGLKEIGIHDDFFELGGHSLLATQVVSRLRDTFKMDVPIRMLFEASTIAKLSDDLVARESKPGRVAKIARLFLMVENMSPEEVARALQTKAVSA